MPDFGSLYQGAGEQWNVSPLLLQSMAMRESNEDPNAVGPVIRSGPAQGQQARGLMQFIPGTAEQYRVDVTDPKSSVYGAANYMRDLLDKHRGDTRAALAAYNGSHPESPYVNDVMDRFTQLSNAWGVGSATKNFKTPSRVPDVFTEENRYSPASPTRGQVVREPGRVPYVQPYAPPPGAGGGQPAPAAPAPSEPDMAENDVEQAILEGKPIPGSTGAAPTPTAPAGPSGEDIEQAILEGRPIPGVSGERPPVTNVSGAFQRYVAEPIHDLRYPAEAKPGAAPLFGVPALQEGLSGVGQGIRDVETFVDRGDKYLADRFPLYAQLDRLYGYEPGSNTPRLEAETKAYEGANADSWVAPVGRFGGNMVATAPVSGPAKVVGAVARAAPYVGRYLAPAAEGAVSGAGFNLLTSQGKTPEEWGADAQSGALWGAGIGGALGAARNFFTRSARPADQAIADRLGIRLSTGQSSGGTLKGIEDATAIMPGSGANRFAGEQRQQIANVIAREGGMPQGVPITTDVLNAAQTRIGTAIEDAARRIDIPGTPQLGQNLQQIAQAALQAGPATQQADTARNLIRQLSNLYANNGGRLPGSEFQSFIARGGPIDTALGSSVPEVRAVGQRMREALLDAGQSGGAGTQEALRDLRNARYQWKVVQTVRPAMDRTATGSEEMLLPGLRTAIANEFGLTRTGQGQNMSDLAKLIAGPLRALPSSGTAERTFVQRMLMGELGVGAPTGAAAHFLAGLPIAHSVAAGVGLPLAVGSIVGRGLRYGIPGGDALFNRLLPAAGANVLRPPT